jgi:hypothetical protein
VRSHAADHEVLADEVIEADAARDDVARVA